MSSPYLILCLICHKVNFNWGELLKKIPVDEISMDVFLLAQLEEVYGFIEEKKYDLILAEHCSANEAFFSLVKQLQDKVPEIPILLIGSESDKEIARQALQLGVQDYLLEKDLTPSILSRAIFASIERQLLRDSIRALSFKDELTDVYNRRGFITLVQGEMELAKRMKKGFILFLIDLDYLKKINDTYGHNYGDQTLKTIAECLKGTFRGYDIIGRLGGDEFAVAAFNALLENAISIKERFLQKLKSHPFTLEAPFSLTVSVGITHFDGSKLFTLDELLQQADEDLYQEKRKTHSQN